ncbi:uncharacterized protein LOC130668503 [Microplitis mediator]|uniref:uncharacterized protein LOC130668503 n=1 Tax=Microplitis mediator TaxID=375433 RepID=UPI0025523847|nr:uncharacterized protein LOC130668503 [Microplitis mediator]XP_057326815.1 uncharacterized protein LOC130668503 [Microplitis mediator]
MAPRTHKRNPYPVPDISSEGFWVARGPALGKNVSANDRTWSTKVDVAERLFSHHTLNSIRRDQRIIRPNEPNDALDFALSSIYIHDEDFMVPKMYVFMQPETLNLKSWRQLRNELEPPSKQPTTTKTFKSKILPKSMGTNVATATAMPVSKITVNTRDTGRVQRKINSPAVSPSDKYRSALSGKKSRAATADKKSIAVKSKEYSQSSDDILDKNQRRLTYAAQMRAIERIHPSSLKLAIEGPHTDLTNPGYSRKADGTFYSI